MAGLQKTTAVILEPVTQDWTWLDAITGPLDDDFVQAVNEPPGEQVRSGLAAFE